MCHTVTGYMVFIHITLSLVGSPLSDTLLRFSCGASPQECAQAADDSDLDPALSTRALSLHFWDWDQTLGEGRVLCSEWGWTRACCVWPEGDYLVSGGAPCLEPAHKILPLTRSWGENLTSKVDQVFRGFEKASSQDPTHDKVMRRKPDRQGGSGFQGFQKAAPSAHLKDDICLFDACFYRLLPNFCDIGRRPFLIPFQIRIYLELESISTIPGGGTLWDYPGWKECFNLNSFAGISVCWTNAFMPSVLICMIAYNTLIIK